MVNSPNVSISHVFENLFQVAAIIMHARIPPDAKSVRATPSILGWDGLRATEPGRVRELKRFSTKESEVDLSTITGILSG